MLFNTNETAFLGEWIYIDVWEITSLEMSHCMVELFKVNLMSSGDI